MKKIFILLAIYSIFTSCDPEIFVPNTLEISEKNYKVDESEDSLAFDKIVIKPLKVDFQDPELVNQVNKIAIKNIHNFTDLNVIFALGNKDLQNLESYTLDLRIYKNANYDLEVRVFENQNKTLIYKKAIVGIKRSNIFIESERQLRKVFKVQLRKYKPMSKVSSLDK